MDGDTRSLRVLEVSLRKAGFTVTPAASVQDALDKLELHAPDLIISETTFTDGDGFELRRRVRATPDWAEIPFIFLTAEAAIENKIRGLELGVDDYLTKPIYIKEIVTRINILLQKRQRIRFEERKDGRTRFAGRVADMPVVDVIQTIEISRKSGVIQFVGERGRQAAIYFRDGKVIDAEAGTLQGEDAVYRLLTWSEGEFEVVFRTVRRREVITTSSQGLLMEGMRRLDEWSRLLEQLPPLTHRFEIDTAELAARLGDVPDDNNKILRLIDGRRTLLEVIDASDFGDLECLQAITRLFFEELLLDLDHAKPARRITGRPIPLVEVEFPTPIEEVASGPHVRPPASPLTNGAAARSAAMEPAVEPTVELAAEEPVPGALLGGYRPSSLRLIDEAVAAAQAIEPSLFEDAPAVAASPPAASPGPTPAASRAFAPMPAPVRAPSSTPAPVTILPSSAVHEFVAEAGTATDVDDLPEIGSDEDSVPHEIPADEPSPPRRRKPTTAPALVPPYRPGREDSGLRMIGSLGRDRAEASGEVALGMTPPRLSETARELVTILPRRITREMQVVPASASTTPSAASTPSPSPVEPPVSRTPPRRFTTQGSGVVSARSGPSPLALVFFGIAAVLGLVAIVLWIQRPAGAQKVTPVADAGVVAIDASQVATAPPADATPLVKLDAAPPPPLDAPPVDSALSPTAQARADLAAATTAFQDGEHERALELANASLELRRTARAYLVRAQAQHRLGRIDDALASVDLAEGIAPEFASVYEVRGGILWAMRRWDDAHDAYNRFLEIEQDTPRADRIRRRLAEPH